MSRLPFVTSSFLPCLARLAAESWPESRSFTNFQKIARQGSAHANGHVLREFVDLLPDIDPSIREMVYTMLVQDAEIVAQRVDDLEKRQQQANGSFVHKIDVFSDPISHIPLLVRKPIAMASKLSKSNRGLLVGGAYGFGGSSIFSRPSLRENRPVENLLMLRFLIHAIEEVAYPDYLCKFFARPWITLDNRGQAFQVMEYLDTSAKIFNQTLPRNGRTLIQLVANLCDAACVSNVTFQCDCSAANLCFLRDASGDIYDIRSFDCDIMYSGDEGDPSELLDFTNLSGFDAENSSFQINTTLGCFDASAALPPIISSALYNALNRSLNDLGAIALAFSSDRSQGIPYLLQPGGLLEQWLARVMILGEDGRLYQNSESADSVDFDESAALFVLCRVGCANRPQSLFANLSFVDLRERYEQTCSPKREAELMSFFRHFGIEEWEEICPSMNSVSLFEDVRMHASEYF